MYQHGTSSLPSFHPFHSIPSMQLSWTDNPPKRQPHLLKPIHHYKLNFSPVPLTEKSRHHLILTVFITTDALMMSCCLLECLSPFWFRVPQLLPVFCTNFLLVLIPFFVATWYPHDFVSYFPKIKCQSTASSIYSLSNRDWINLVVECDKVTV